MEIKVISALLPMDMNNTIYISRDIKDVKRIAKLSLKDDISAIRFFLRDSVMIFWNAYGLNHQEVINHTNSFDETILSNFGVQKDKLKLRQWHRGSIGFRDGDDGFYIEDIDPRTEASEHELLNFLKSCLP